METVGFLKDKEHNMVTNYKVDTDSHDNERAIGQSIINI